MKRIERVTIEQHSNSLSYMIGKYFDDGSNEEIAEMEPVEVCVKMEPAEFRDKVISKIQLLETGERLQFRDCIFMSEIDLNFSQSSGAIFFSNCIFMDNFTLFGDFPNVVSFEACTFFGSKVDFQECDFSHFVFNLSMLYNCTVNFQETHFYGSHTYFGNAVLNNSKFLFNNSFFNANAELLDFTATQADERSKLLFDMVDFQFKEVRLFGADLKCLEFRDCSFECNRFDFDCSCETLIFQSCRNFKVLSLNKVRGLKKLNVCNLINTGKILVSADTDYYVNAIKSTEEIIWERGTTYRSPTNEDYRNQLYLLMSFYDLSQLELTKDIEKEINIIKKEDDILNNKNEEMKIFLSYTWDDEDLALSVEKKFEPLGIKIVRDKHDLHYRKSVKEFMKQIRVSDYVILIISEKYLQSSNCMFEIAELTKDENYRDRILPIIKEDARIFDVMDRTRYINYWQDKYKELESRAKTLEELNRGKLIRELIQYERIKRDLLDFIYDISDMDGIICNDELSQIDFEKLCMIIFPKDSVD